MSKRADAHLAEMLDNRWSYTATGTNSTLTPTVVAAPGGAKDVRHLDFFYMTILNKNTLDFTMAAQIRDASAAGTVLAQFPLILDGSTNMQVAPAGIHLMASPGAGLFFTTDTVAPSVTATVNAAGWTDTTTYY